MAYVPEYPVEGFNTKEQKLLDHLLDGEPHSIRNLKKIFLREARTHCRNIYNDGWGETHVDEIAQSFVRNSIRRLVNDFWVERSARGVFKLSVKGRNKIKKGVCVTDSHLTKESNKKPKKTKPVVKKEAPKKQARKAKKATARKAKKETTKKKRGRKKGMKIGAPALRKKVANAVKMTKEAMAEEAW